MKRRPMQRRHTIKELNRMIALRREGLSYPAIAGVLRLDSPDREWDGEMVRNYLFRYGPPDVPKHPRGRPFGGRP